MSLAGHLRAGCGSPGRRRGRLGTRHLVLSGWSVMGTLPSPAT